MDLGLISQWYICYCIVPTKELDLLYVFVCFNSDFYINLVSLRLMSAILEKPLQQHLDHHMTLKLKNSNSN